MGLGMCVGGRALLSHLWRQAAWERRLSNVPWATVSSLDCWLESHGCRRGRSNGAWTSPSTPRTATGCCLDMQSRGTLGVARHGRWPERSERGGVDVVGRHRDGAVGAHREVPVRARRILFRDQLYRSTDWIPLWLTCVTVASGWRPIRIAPSAWTRCLSVLWSATPCLTPIKPAGCYGHGEGATSMLPRFGNVCGLRRGTSSLDALLDHVCV